MAETRSYKRRQFIVHTGLQWRYVFWLVLTVGIISLALGSMLGMTVSSTTALVLKISPNSEILEPRLIAMDRRTMTVVVTLLALNLIFVAALGIFVSHRIAGPLHKLKQHMAMIAQGDFSARIKFRKSDVLPDVADAFNAMAEALERRDAQRGDGQPPKPTDGA
ncbi:MAG: HAMP domain-containing protein [Planctomycetes bacterium]|nr:HAMP domain-containing protein [Planctomycetota bacterium]